MASVFNLRKVFMSKTKSVTVEGVDIVRNQPVVKFMYKGTHSKPIRRTVILAGSDRNKIWGYEVREGRTTRLIGDAYKTYCRSDIRDMKRFSLNESF